ncbi:MAG: porin family protein [Candidatus Eisenbacteria bacterium]|uniref:Porin family protein n=1 Tax=Eiseniibacteriota bacterium TaxID=2212470 RepID=A0A948W2G4_UNCEI|nr:porin family protein [Candidatus Eisenbacteria bacterium]MBU1950011.1 porin family protein [Candidatus Eisenbacteria bacterium]MBU2689917.1 porin family protein [Candidatus Eisenbacteria bacterium]
MKRSRRANALMSYSHDSRGAGLAVLLVLGGFLAGAPAYSASSDGWAQVRGFSAGLQLETNLIGVEDQDVNADPDQLFIDDIGRGVVLNLDYTFTPAFTLRLAVGSALHETTQMDVEAYHACSLIEAQWRFLPMNRVRPYLIGGLGGTALRMDSSGSTAETSGGMTTIGAGFLYNFTKHLLWDMSVRLDLINWSHEKFRYEHTDGTTTELKAPVNGDGRAGKFHMGLSWVF